MSRPAVWMVSLHLTAVCRSPKGFTLFRLSWCHSEGGVSVWVWGTPSEPPIDHLDQVCVGVLTSDDQKEPETDAEESINQYIIIYYYRWIYPAVQLECRELLMMVQTSRNVNKRPLDVRGRSVRTRRGSPVTDGGRSHPSVVMVLDRRIHPRASGGRVLWQSDSVGQ